MGRQTQPYQAEVRTRQLVIVIGDDVEFGRFDSLDGRAKPIIGPPGDTKIVLRTNRQDATIDLLNKESVVSASAGQGVCNDFALVSSNPANSILPDVGLNLKVINNRNVMMLRTAEPESSISLSTSQDTGAAFMTSSPHALWGAGCTPEGSHQRSGNRGTTGPAGG